MKNGIANWFNTAAFAGLAIALSGAGNVIAQPPGRGPGGPDGPGRGGPPNVAEMFSRMDRNKDGRLTQDEVPEPMWNRLSNADADGDRSVTKDEAAKAIPGRRPDGGRPDGPPNARSREDQADNRGPRPPMDRERGESRGQRDASPDRGRPQPHRSPDQPDRERTGRPENNPRGPASFGPDAFFDRLDRNGDGNLSRDEFKAVAEFHRSLQSTRGRQGFSRHRGPTGPPMAHRGPHMRGGGPPWARNNRGNSFGPRQFQGGPPWAHSGHGPQFNRGFAGPPWAQSAQRPRGPHDGASPQGPRHRDVESRDHNSRGPRPQEGERSPSNRPDRRDRTDADSPQADAELTTDDSPSASPSDGSVTSSTPAKVSKAVRLPL